MKESFFFTSVSRFVDEDNFKKVDFNDRYSEKNFLVADREDYDPTYYKKHFGVNRHSDNDSLKLSMCFQPAVLSTPVEKFD